MVAASSSPSVDDNEEQERPSKGHPKSSIDKDHLEYLRKDRGMRQLQF